MNNVSEKFLAWGHPNVRATHRGTIELTREESLTPSGDCVVGVAAEKACRDLSEPLKRALSRSEARVYICLTCGGEEATILARGDRRLSLDSEICMVIRKSSYICERTLAVGANKAAGDLSRSLVERLKEGNRLSVKIEVI